MMTIVKDPAGVETAVLNAMFDFKDRQVLEIGCGDGRLTWRYADQAAHVTAIDPDPSEIEIALANRPRRLGGAVDFVAASLEDFTASSQPHRFDLAIFAWSL